MIEADIKTEVRWLLEGHDLKGNDKYYVRITEQKLYEEYQKAIDALTIDPVSRLQKKIDKLEVEKNSFEQLRAQISSTRSEDKIKEKVAALQAGYRQTFPTGFSRSGNVSGGLLYFSFCISLILILLMHKGTSSENR